MAFNTLIPVRFGDEDHAQVVYYPRYFDYLHQGFEDFFNAHAHSYRKVVVEDGIGWPVVRADAQFHAPLRFGDVLDLRIWFSHIGKRSLTTSYRGYQTESAKRVISATVTTACIRCADFSTQAIPSTLRDLFAQFQDPPQDAPSSCA